MSNYVLTRWALGKHTEIPISREEFHAIQEAIGLISAATDIERPFDLVVRSFVEFEKGLASSAVNYMVRPFRGRLDFFHEMQEHLMRLVALLTSCRMYLDQTDRSLKRPPLKALRADAPFAQVRAKHYDGSFSFRLLEALRNFAQHQGQAIDQIAFRSKWVGDKDDQRMQFATDVFVDPEALRMAGKINAKFRNELAPYKDRLDIRVHVGHYVESLGDIQLNVRAWLQETVSAAKILLLSKVAVFKALDANQDATGLVAAEIADNGRMQNEVHIVQSSIEYLDALQATNGMLVNLSKRYVTSEPARKSVPKRP